MSLSLRIAPLLVVTCALTLAAAGCGGNEQRTSADVPSDAIALVGDREVPRAEFDAIVERAKKSYEAQKRPFPKVGSPEYQDLKTRIVSFLVQRYQFRAEAEEMGIEISDEAVDERLEEIKKQHFDGNEKRFAAELERQGLSEEQARAEIRDDLLQQRIYEQVTGDVEVTDEDVEKYYEEHKDQFTQPATREVRHILVKKSKERADELYAQIQDGADFAELARRFSQDPGTKAQGGKYAAVQGQSVPAFDEVAFELEQGEVSEPVKTQFGWHIIKAVSPVRPEKVTPLAEVEESIRQQLEQERKNEAMQRWLDRVEEEYEGEIVYAAGFEPPETETETGTDEGETTTGE